MTNDPMTTSLIEGKNINFRKVVESDAAFILNLRLDNRSNQFMTKTDNDLNKQIQWIRDYQKRPQEYYFIIESKEKEDYGTIRIDASRQDSFCLGSWIIKKGAPGTVAIECVLLTYEFGFYKLGYKNCHFNVIKDNLKVVNFHKRFGAQVVFEDEKKIYFNFTIENYQQSKQRYSKFLPQS